MASDHPAGNHFPGIAGGLAGEIIGVPVDNDGSSDDILDLDPVVIKCSPGITMAGKQRRQVSGMIRMGTARWIKVAACVSKIIRTVAVFMDMETEKTGITAGFRRRKIENLRLYNGAPVHGAFPMGRSIEFYESSDIGIIFAAGDRGYCPQTAAGQKIQKDISGRILEHKTVLFHLRYDTEKKR